MSFVDWLTNSRQRYRSQPINQATAESVEEFYRGATARGRSLLATVRGKKATLSARDTQVTVRADTALGIKRASDLNGEQAVADYLVEQLQPDDVMWDVGAHHGHYSLLGAAAGAEVHAFEPSVENRDQIRQNMQLNEFDGGSITLRPVALSDYDGAISLVGESESELEVVRNNSGEHYARVGDEVSPSPNVVKIDVEGHELSTLRGMEDSLQNVEVVVVEVHAGTRETEVRAELGRAGLTVHRIETPRSQTYVAGLRRQPNVTRGESACR